MKKVYLIKVGDRFGSRVVTGQVFRDGKVVKAPMRCSCGNESNIAVQHILNGQSRNCRKCWRKSGNQKHGMYGSLSYKSWSAMLERCSNPNRPNYPDYGGRGIRVCGRWKKSFTDFLFDMKERPSSGHSIERIDNNKGYYPENCIWGTRKEQARNKRSNRMLEYQGVKAPLIEIVERHGMSYKLVHLRLQRGWSLERALTESVSGALS